MMKKELFDELLGSLEQARDHAQGKITLRSKQMILPKEIKALPPSEIKRMRKQLGASQAVFARLLNVSTATEVKWETGRRRPSGAALRLLDLVKKKPELLYTP